MNKKITTIFSLLSISILLTPIIVIATSCSSNVSDEQIIKPEQPNNPNPEPENPNPPIIPEQPNLDPTSKHTLSQEMMLSAKNPYQILKQTNSFKNAINNIQQRMDSGDWNFKPYLETKGFKEFISMNHEVGIMNEYGKNKYERMTFAAKDVYLENDMTQKLLENFDVNEIFDAELKEQNIDEIILNNQFGFLPSNLSQFLFYLDLRSIENIFNIKNVSNIKMNFDDEKGNAQILIYNKDGNKYLFEYKTNETTALKNNNYFRQYIFDRSFVISFPRIAYTNPIRTQDGRLYQDIEKKWIQGTGWLLDRITNNNTPEGYYDFLVGTNLHVLDLSSAYNMDREKVNPLNSKTELNYKASSDFQRTYEQKWDGGIISLNGENNANPNLVDEIVDKPAGNGFVKYQEFKNNKRVSSLNNLLIKREDVKNNDNNNAGSGNNVKYNIAKTQLNNENFVNDLIQYTPTFSTSGTYMDKSSAAFSAFDLLNTYDKEDFNAKDEFGKEKAYESWDGYRVGTISNSGADFAITKIRISDNDVKNIFPTLYPLLNTENEKNWYVGLGENNKETMINANSTLFIGGYPEGLWKSIKSTSGKIYSQQRYLPKEEPGFTQTFWTKYNEIDNQKYNHFRGSVDWYKNRFTSPSMTKEQNDKYIPHGMQIKKILQHSFISFSNEGKHTNNDILVGGSSGSMMINSRGEIVGLLFQGISNDNPDSYANLGLLFKNYSQDNNNFSIIKQVQQFLKNKKLKTLKLNS